MLGTGEREATRDRDRIVNLSDGVFAIALTLLVLDIRVPNIPENVVAAELPAALLSLWPKVPLLLFELRRDRRILVDALQHLPAHKVLLPRPPLPQLPVPNVRGIRALPNRAAW